VFPLSAVRSAGLGAVGGDAQTMNHNGQDWGDAIPRTLS